MNPSKVLLDGNSLTLEQIEAVARDYAQVDLPESTKRSLAKQRQRLDHQLETRRDVPIYGTNRLHGDLKDVLVPNQVLDEYQRNYVKVHNCGTGNILPISVVRAMMVIRLNSFARLQSGMRLATCQCMIDMLNQRVTPVVNEEGSVGASGDLVPLAMIAATLIGLPQAMAWHQANPKQPPELYSAPEALALAGLAPVELGAKEAMGLSNGSNFIAGIAALECLRSERLLSSASITTSLTLEAMRGEQKAFGPIINEKSHRSTDQVEIAQQVRRLIQNSKRCSKAAQEVHFAWSPKQSKWHTNQLLAGLVDDQHRVAVQTILDQVTSHPDDRQRMGCLRQVTQQLRLMLEPIDNQVPDSPCRLPDVVLEDPVGVARTLLAASLANRPTERVQDRYSIRAVPQVHGATRKAIRHLRETIEEEINSATDNPLFDFQDSSENELLQFASGANFHGQPLAGVIDYAKISLTSLGLLSDKRSFSMLSKGLSYGLPPALAYDSSDADGGLMITQYAGAARAADNRILATPASVMSLSTAANQEDFVSMGSLGAVNLIKVNDNLAKILGIELLCAVRALQLTNDWLPEDLRPLGQGTQKLLDWLSDSARLPPGDERDAEANLQDHYLAPDIELAAELVESRELQRLVGAQS